MKNIYEFIVSNASLSEKHKKELKEKRGLSEETIKKNRFVSGGNYLLNLESELIANFKEDALIESGVCIHDGKSAHISPILLEDRIIIPYLDKESRAYYIRPHKLGLKNVSVEIYQELNFERSIILTEGEFKAAAGMQYGFNAIAIPGISSFSDQHFPRLAKLFHDHKVRDICIIFDNEVKDDPKFPKRYKENPANRFDTQFYAYLMAKMLEREGFNVRIGTLPDGWQEDGKIDIDGALAQGRSKEQIADVISRAVPYRVYAQELSKDVQQIIKRKETKRYFRANVRREFGRYVATRRRGKNEYDEIISNFTLKIIATHQTPEGIIREIQFTNQFGEVTTFFSIAPESMCGSDGFATFCMSHGNFIWKGTKEDLHSIWEEEFLNDDGRHITEPDHIGWIEEEKMWLFGNVAIGKDGKEIRGDRNHTFWTDKKGIKPVALGVSSGRAIISEGIPYLSLNNFDLKALKGKLEETIGVFETAECLGWITAVPFLEEVFDQYGCFPFLFITGRRGSGKSTIAEWLANFFGLENAGKMAADTTAVGLQRYLAYYSSLPVFLDEYRNTKQITYKNGFLRNVYNRQAAGKGIKADFGVREAKIRGTLIISGEETPEDNALLTRCVVVSITEKNRKENHFNWFMSNRTKFSNHILEVLRNKKELLLIYNKVLDEAKNYFVENGADDRTAINYAVVSAGYAVAFGEDNLDFAKWITTEAVRAKEESDSEQAVSVFLDDMVALKTRGMINDAYWQEDTGRIYLYFHGLYNIWSEYFRKARGIEPFKASSIRDYLKEEPGFLEMNSFKRIKGMPKKCVVFDSASAPEQIKALVAGDLRSGVDVEPIQSSFVE